MSKYHCLCGSKFKCESDAIMHLEIFQNSMIDYHFILTNTKRKCFWSFTNRKRFWSFFRIIPFIKSLRLFGAYLIYGIVISHFNIKMDICESILICIGIGLYIK